MSFATNASGTWATSSLYSGSMGSAMPMSLAMSSSGTVHALLQDTLPTATVKYASYSGGTWSSPATITTGENQGAILLDSTGKLHAVFWRSATSDLVYSSKPSGGSWSAVTVIDNANMAASFNSISAVLDSSDKVHVAYWPGSGNVRYATNAGGSWAHEQVIANANSSFQTVSIAIKPNGTVLIAYQIVASLDLGLSSGTAGSWTNSTIASSSSAGYSAGIFAYTNSLLYALHWWNTGTGNYMHVPYSTDGSSWVTSHNSTTDTVTDNTQPSESEMIVDSGGAVHYCYYTGSSQDLVYVTNNTSNLAWSPTTIDSSGSVGRYCKIAVHGAKGRSNW